MKYMLIMRAVDQRAVEDFANADFNEVIAAMGDYNESMDDSGVLVDGAQLSDAEEGSVVDISDDEPVLTYGPYGELRELFNGFWIFDVSTKEEAIEWAKRAPLGPGSQLEIRRINDVDDFPQDNEWIQKEQEWINQGKLKTSRD